MPIFIYLQEMWQLAVTGKTQGIWFWSAFYVLLLCAYSTIYQIRIRQWPSTQGELVNLGIEKFGAAAWVKSKRQYVSGAVYHYNVAGERYEGTRISPWIFVASHNAKAILKKQVKSVRRDPNGSVKVFYNPRNPKKSFLLLPGKVGVSVTAALCVLPMFLFWLKYHQ